MRSPGGPNIFRRGYWSRQEVHTLGIGTGNERASRTGPGPNIPLKSKIGGNC